MNKIIYDTDFFSLTLEDEILVVVYKKGPITLEIAKDLVKNRHAFSQGNLYPILVCDNGIGINSFDRDAREYMGKGEATEGILATAFYTKSSFNKYIINFFLRISNKSSNFPIKVFSDKKEATKWLENFVENQ